ncbi:MAG TPA: hypothetical protein VM347_44375 [Nonomuraea sp.]|nr:hypothetical protein [Nonomuraea sp.]
MSGGWVHDDGGRAAAGFKGSAGDCATRAIAIATGLPYQEAYGLVNEHAKRERKGTKRRGMSNARTGVHKVTMQRVMAALGWQWTPTMRIGQGCTVHLTADELPAGRIIVSLSRHYAAVIDGVVYDTHDPRRETHYVRSGGGGAGGPPELRPGEWRNSNGICGVSRRCVYGYWSRT